MSHRALADFNEFLYQNIPLVRFMQLQLISCNDNKLTASAPAQPNLNDKQTIFGGSSAALMTVCGWSLIKFNLEQRQLSNDVVIGKANIRWRIPQSDDLLLTAESAINWPELCKQVHQADKQPRLKVLNHISNKAQQICSQMNADFIILKGRT